MMDNRKITIYDLKGDIIQTATLKSDRVVEHDDVGTVHQNVNDFMMQFDIDNISRIDFDESTDEPKTLIDVFRHAGMLDGSSDRILLKDDTNDSRQHGFPSEILIKLGKGEHACNSKTKK